MRYLIYCFWLIVIILGVTFASLNPISTKINYYINTTAIHLPILLLITLIIGAALGSIAMLPILIRTKRAKRQMKQKIKQAELEVKNLRAIPIKDEH